MTGRRIKKADSELLRILHLCTFVLILLPAPCASAQEDSVHSVRFGAGYKEYRFGIPFLYLEGTDYEVGLQYGTLLKDELGEVYEEFEQLKDEIMEKEIRYLPWYQRIFARLFGGMVLRHKFNAYADRLSPDIQEQLEGAAEGSGLPISFFQEFQVTVDAFSRRCEGIVIEQGGKIYHGHNLDQQMPLSRIGRYPLVAHYGVEGRPEYWDIGFVGCFSITTAFNEYGISYSENGNNNPKPFDATNVDLYIAKNRIMTGARNLKEVDSLMNGLTSPLGLLVTIASSREKHAVVYDLLGPTKAATPVDNNGFIGNKTMSTALGKKSESIYAADFHEAAREFKFAELLDTTGPSVVDEAIKILSNADFYHYTDSLSVHIESLHNFETDQSVVFALADSTVYFACAPHFAAWSRWLKYNYRTREVSVYREANPKLSSPALSAINRIFEQVESCDWRDSSNVRSLVNAVAGSGINNYFSLSFLSTTYLDYYHLPAEAAVYAKKVINKYPDVVTGYFQNGRALEEQNQLPDAIAQYQLALGCRINCDYYLAGTYERLALAHHHLGNNELAAEYSAKALAIHNQFWIPDHLVGRIHELETIGNSNR